MDVVFSVVCGSPFLLWERLGKWYNFAVGFDRRAMEIGCSVDDCGARRGWRVKWILPSITASVIY